jgi:hypothetical protein
MSKIFAVVAAGLLLCGVSGYAIAQTGSAAAKPVRACAAKAGGALRLGKRCHKNERRVSWAAKGPGGLTGPTGGTGATGADGVQGPAGTNGADGTNGTNGIDGTSGTSTGETFFASAGFGANFGGGVCDVTPFGGPSITFTAPAGSYAQVMASVTVQRAAGATSNIACVHVDSTDVQFSSSVSLGAETRYLQRGSTGGTTDPLAGDPLTIPLSAGSHTISMRYGSTLGTSNFSNRNLYVTVFHPTQ